MEQVLSNKEITVDGWRYLVSHPQVEAGFEVGVELMKMIGGSAASMATAGGEDKIAAALTSAVSQLLGKMDPKTSMALIKRILSTVEAQGEEGGASKKILLNETGIRSHFQGRLGSMLRLTGEVIAFTHASFFDAIVEGVATTMKKASAKMEAVN